MIRRRGRGARPRPRATISACPACRRRRGFSPRPPTPSPCASSCASSRARSPRWPARSAHEGAILGAIDLVRVDQRGVDARRDRGLRRRRRTAQRVVNAVRALDGVNVVERLRPHVPDAQGRQDRDRRPKVADQDPRRPLDGLHAGRRARLVGDRRRPRVGLDADDQGQHGRGRLRRHGRARARRHRPRGGDAGDGGQGDAVQGARRRRRLPALPGHDRRRRDRARSSRASRRRSAASTSRTSPRRAASRSSGG